MIFLQKDYLTAQFIDWPIHVFQRNLLSLAAHAPVKQLRAQVTTYQEVQHFHSTIPETLIEKSPVVW